MAKTSGRTRGRRAAARLAAAAAAAALVGTGASAFAADNPNPSAKASVKAAAAKAAAHAAAKGAKHGVTKADGDPNGAYPVFSLIGVDRSGNSYAYLPDYEGGFSPKMQIDEGQGGLKNGAQVDNDADGVADGIWKWNTQGTMTYEPYVELETTTVGGGWNIYNTLLSPGNLGGAGAGDLLGRDSSGNLYLYLGYGNGKLTSRYLVGGGWGQYTALAGNGDLTGDGKADIVARGGDGTLWLYKGTGNYKAPFEGRTKIGGGWNTYNALVSSGDVDLDGTTDLLGRDAAGALYLYKGTGSAAAPYKPRVKIGNGGWNTYRLMF
ncbi:FG-GAP repeat domain-containing protein [Streptomyces sp. ERV7]|uniref:FG-GAP repeat domain-containing protein n=1 Tax=Streptomyces sp. ERV7 TaxID=1322334 RepID=UPI000A7E2CF2|nr:VCBS repeat-containing protein [Streptomyces sp. ERV7]